MWNLKDRTIGDGSPVFLIAEAGVNHNGDPGLAHKLIDAAAEAGADAVKFQTFLTEELVASHTPPAGHHEANVPEKISHFELIKRLELSFEVFPELKAHCEKRGMVFISTPYDIPSAEFLVKMEVEAIKIASSEMTNFPLLEEVGKSEMPVILSTGMSAWEEIVESVNFLRKYHDKICVLKCTSNYPASPSSINLRGVLKLKETFPDLLVGFSDHSEGPEISLSALGIGLSVIERHFTLDKSAWGPDHKASMTPEEFGRLVLAVRKCEAALGSRDWGIQDEEVSQRMTMQKGVFARRAMQEGEAVTLEDVKFLRPSGQISPKAFYLKYMNTRITQAVEKDQELTPGLFTE